MSGRFHFVVRTRGERVRMYGRNIAGDEVALDGDELKRTSIAELRAMVGNPDAPLIVREVEGNVPHVKPIRVEGKDG